jgi:hypothetical protein
LLAESWLTCDFIQYLGRLVGLGHIWRGFSDTQKLVEQKLFLAALNNKNCAL